ncbi:MAG: RidA family protein [Gammaproteobacteria bacterium]|nr:RidA family protein [Gammaproteobacteria bacterium]MCY4219369.1 RidA family protein [Gammaproteobacteria bacterium]MCY4275979.1 RidA family protein [Gammaproteobacteria bacterium]
MQHREIISTDQSPKAIGTYSQAVRVDNTVYISGQIPLDPNTMEMIGESFAEAAHQTFKNLNAICTAAGGRLCNIAKLNVYVTDLSQFPILNEVMAEYFHPPYPARAVVGVSALPKDAPLEIEAVMVLD